MQCPHFEHCNPASITMILTKYSILFIFEFWKNCLVLIVGLCWFSNFTNKFNAIAGNRKMNFFNGLQQKLNFSNIVVNHKRWLFENAIKLSLCLKMFVVSHWSEKWSLNMRGIFFIFTDLFSVTIRARISNVPSFPITDFVKFVIACDKLISMFCRICHMIKLIASKFYILLGRTLWQVFML